MLLIVDSESEGQRLDNFLVKKIRNIPKSRIYRMVRKGEVRLNSGRVKPCRKLTVGDKVRVPSLAGLEIKVKQAPEISASGLNKKLNEISIIADKPDFFVINKPINMAAHGVNGDNLGLVELTRRLYPSLNLQLVHRLDKATSGLIIVSKKRSSLVAFHNLLRNGEIKKKYLAVCVNNRKNISIPREVNKPLRRTLDKNGNRYVVVDNDGQFALTKIRLLKVEKESSLGHRYLLECIPITGRTHQLRAHLLSIGLPILGDKRYYEEQSSSFLKQFSPSRLYLHAWKLRFRDPVNGTWEDFEAPVPDAFKKIFHSALKL